MSKHTPGPWFPINNKFYWEVRTKDHPYDGQEIAQCAASKHLTSGDNGPANARLIAAAPDLLAALEDILKVAEADLALTSNPHPMREAVVNSARAAIAKARGEA